MTKDFYYLALNIIKYFINCSNKPILHDNQELYLNKEIDENDKNKTIGSRPFLV